MSKQYTLLTLLLVLLNSCGVFKSYEKHPKTEFRGVWIATVVNIDWPKNGNDTSEKQKADYLKILDFYQKENYNAVIVQVRAAGDAFYESKYAPYSRFLTGEEGKAPKWNTNVLDWMILEAHERGMEFHAWLNPYRATFDENFEVLSETHDYCTHPEWMVHYGTKNYYNPGLPEVRAHFANIIAELVSNYDIDAIHFDDYFYPYKIKDAVFNDSLAFETYAQKGQHIDDWRRSNIDSLVKQSHETINSIKPWVQLGISPFGVWKNNSTDPRGSDTKAGQTTYEDLYADPLLWMEKGWIDYLAPQVYWSMDLPVASHRKIVDWWSNNNFNTKLYIGNGPYKIRNNADKAWEDFKELPNQLKLARETPQIAGNIMFSAKSLMSDKDDVVEYIHKKYYKLPALNPAFSISNKSVYNTPHLSITEQNEKDFVLHIDSTKNMRYALLYSSGRKAKEEYPIKKLVFKIFLDGNPNRLLIPRSEVSDSFLALSFIDVYGVETEPTIINIKQLIKNDSKR
ncbi:glycoside hydrolase family 10 protein [Maribacter hydrothermalis]|uniref:Glycosyl hydrolase n=1 Tax=Maribacter hydrothermalis TaxID=1836467 RepID=A0A1B7ZDE0_9FLAO|nr:family 10 glycosylhydrolase [Maribacter hydrothermalis]APQ18468.1 glycosyl hydrolase [Maribacter hydrothermalis]OBR41325.1 glycosyl hydrolase [Maribacter hydrothermalis]